MFSAAPLPVLTKGNPLKQRFLNISDLTKELRDVQRRLHNAPPRKIFSNLYSTLPLWKVPCGHFEAWVFLYIFTILNSLFLLVPLWSLPSSAFQLCSEISISPLIYNVNKFNCLQYLQTYIQCLPLNGSRLLWKADVIVCTIISGDPVRLNLKGSVQGYKWLNKRLTHFTAWLVQVRGWSTY